MKKLLARQAKTYIKLARILRSVSYLNSAKKCAILYRRELIKENEVTDTLICLESFKSSKKVA